jgi:hypothetical protein
LQPAARVLPGQRVQWARKYGPCYSMMQPFTLDLGQRRLRAHHLVIHDVSHELCSLWPIRIEQSLGQNRFFFGPSGELSFLFGMSPFVSSRSPWLEAFVATLIIGFFDPCMKSCDKRKLEDGMSRQHQVERTCIMRMSTHTIYSALFGVLSRKTSQIQVLSCIMYTS